MVAEIPRDNAIDTEDMWAEYFMTYDGGLNVRQFVKLLRRFAKLVNIVETDLHRAASSSVPEPGASNM